MNRNLPLVTLLLAIPLFSYAQQGFFLDTWTSKSVETPGYTDADMTDQQVNVSITVHPQDTLTKIPLYMFGDNANAYTTSMSDNKTLMKYMAERNMGVLRGPSGSISDVYFWNRSHFTPPSDVPAVLLAGGDNPGWEWYGKRPGEASWTMDVDSFYRILEQTNVTGLITVNYGYARYGTGDDPVAQAAHMAAEWVRYDNGRTKFWEIGNEVFGSWEAGYRIDRTLNKDGQPEYINGTLYGKHCRVFIDSMKAAAAETGAEIFIGAVTAETSSSGPTNWNVDLMREVGDDIDFYIIHSYYTPWNQNSNAQVILNTPPQTQGYMNYVNSCVTRAGKSMKPVALTEYNIFAIGSKQMVSQIGGMFAVMVVGEAIKAGVGEASRWDLANGYSNGDDHGMFSYGDEPGVTRFSPRPAFYYLYYMQKYMGNVLLKSTFKGTSDISAYSSKFSSGHVSAIITNKGVNTQFVRVNYEGSDLGNRFYTFTLTGGTDVPANPLMAFSRKVIVNGEGPAGVAGGPLNYATLKARSSVIGNEIVVEAPPFSVVYLLADTGSRQITLNDTIYPAIKWSNPADIVYGTPLSSTQLNATTGIPGTFHYDPPSGTVLNSSSGRDLNVTFVPADTSVYSRVTRTVKINIVKATPVITWNNPEDIIYPAPLDSVQLNATANVAGTFVYDPPAGTILGFSAQQSLSVTFYPEDTVNYKDAVKTAVINVLDVTGISDLSRNEVRIYPVPVFDKLILKNLPAGETGKTLFIQIIGMDGTVIRKASIAISSGSHEIDVNGLPPGVYMLSLYNGEKTVMRKFVKE